MVALVPSVVDAARLVVDGGEPAEQLHATLVYLGDAADYPPYVRELLYGIVAAEAEDLGPITADGFSVSLFNPGTEDVCVVLGLSGGDLGAIHETVTEKVAEALALVGVELPEQHDPFVPHVTIAYGDDPAVIKAVAGKTGSVTFDRIRLAFGGDVIDIPLGSPAERADWVPLVSDDDGLDEETLALVEALSRFDGDPSRAGFDSAEHPRIPKGKPGGGRFLSIADRIEKAIKDHHAGNGHGDPFAGFNREQLRKAAKAKGITLKRGASQDDIAKALLDHTDHKHDDHKIPEPAPKAPRKKAVPKKAAEKPAEQLADSGDADGHGYIGPTYHLPAGVTEADMDSLREKIRSDLFAWQSAAHGGLMKAPDQEGAELVDRVGNGAATRAAWEADAEKRLTEFVQRMRPEKDDPRAPLDPVTPAELDRAKQEAARQLQQEFAGRDIATRTTEDGLARILFDGRFKTQFETKKSKGTYAPKRRAVIEDAMFGIRADSDPAQRPVYGYVATTDLDVPDPDNELNMYGGVRVVLKPHVRSRTTATLGDSLNDGVIPSPVNDPSWESFNPRWRYGSKELDYDKVRDRLYAEAQIHGGVSVDDIARVVFDSPPSATLETALRARGIPWKVVA